MFVSEIKDINAIEMKASGAENALKQVLIGPEQGWKGYVMRLITLKNKGKSPRHVHPWPHINFIVSGKGILYMDGKEYPLEAGSIAYVPDDIEHQYLSFSDDDLVFICIVPEEGDK